MPVVTPLEGMVRGHNGAIIRYLETVPAALSTEAPVVILHGTLNTGRDWLDTAARITERTGRRVLAPHRRGRATSADFGPDYDVMVEVTDLCALLDRTGPGTILIGHSYGAVVSLLASTARTDLGALVLYEPPLPLDRPVTGGALHRIRAALDRRDLDTALSTIHLDVLGDSAHTLAQLRTLPSWSERLTLAASSCVELAALDELTGLDLAPYAALTVPTTVIQGARSDRPPFGTPARAVASVIPGAELVVLPGHGHVANFTAPREIADLFVAAIDAAPVLR
ncbi:pimeloyl-ACP methyl ester carboxylesterase [Krasilnikovia cinnamomea]|uniref:Pimeloyl-ACP methyl ester carboxylesterase n=1 Tax=Krasilnikovia cinnamomea TaxID=349313 RepID=A0A4Q7ZJX4_9ACTN|nr:pimeloyl-ACP methyl ester carboxylesterase [Krasilnikovia cinnamomea]